MCVGFSWIRATMFNSVLVAPFDLCAIKYCSFMWWNLLHGGLLGLFGLVCMIWAQVPENTVMNMD